VMDQAVRKTIEDLTNQGIAGRYDTLTKVILDIVSVQFFL